MTLNEAKALKPRQKLQWKGKNRWPVVGATPYQIWARSEGEIVEFVDFDGEREDNSGFPIIRVKTKTGEKTFSSCWFV